MAIKALGEQVAVSEIVLWTDSTSVLKWINSDILCHKRFIARRIKFILRLNSFCDYLSYRPVPMLGNAADVASRGITLSPNDLERAELWLSGPSFLTRRDDWPRLLDVTSTPLDCEIRDFEIDMSKIK